MSAELVPTTAVPAMLQETVHLVARNPLEMQNAQADLTAWLTRKMEAVEVEIADFEAAIDHARQSKWGTAPLTKAKNKAVGELLFYTKLKDAVEAGYTIIPEFPIDVFAIRVTRELPKEDTASSTSTYSPPTIPDEVPDIAPSGEGDYKSPLQMVNRWQEGETDKEGKPLTRQFIQATGFQDVIFPVRAARVEVMDATSQAMALKIFDRIGICPATRKADPLIIGQVLGRKNGYSQKVVSFIIAWHLNLNEL